MAKAKKKAAKKRTKGRSVKSVMTQKHICGCGAAKVVRVADSTGKGAHGMCRDVNGVTRKKNGSKRHAGSFSKAASC